MTNFEKAIGFAISAGEAFPRIKTDALLIAGRHVQLGNFVVAAIIAIALSSPALSRSEVEGRATKVRDADTIVVAGVPVRLKGVDAPENSTRAGREATAYMKRLLRGRVVKCDLSGERTYDRWVGVCYIDHEGRRVDIGAVLISGGYALDCTRYSGGRYRALEPAGARQRLQQASYC